LAAKNQEEELSGFLHFLHIVSDISFFVKQEGHAFTLFVIFFNPAPKKASPTKAIRIPTVFNTKNISFFKSKKESSRAHKIPAQHKTRPVILFLFIST